jgi:hypothetical protein
MGHPNLSLSMCGGKPHGVGEFKNYTGLVIIFIIFSNIETVVIFSSLGNLSIMMLLSLSTCSFLVDKIALEIMYCENLS